MTLTLQGNGTLNGLTVLGAPVTTLANTGTAASPSLVFDGDSDTGLFRPGANQLGLSVGGLQDYLLQVTELLNFYG